MTQNKRRHQQRQRRRTNQVKRVEVVLSYDNDRDRAINDFLANIPRGQGGEFIKASIYAAIRQRQPGDDPTARILREVEAIRQEIAARPVLPAGVLMSDTSAASGLDMSRPRKGGTAKTAIMQTTAQTTPIKSNEENGRALLASVTAMVDHNRQAAAAG